jgi:hypothetical protein
MRNTLSTTRNHLRMAAATALAGTAVIGGAAYASSVTAAPTVVASASSTASSTAPAATPQVRLHLKPSSPQLAYCFPYAKAKVTVDLTTEAKGKDKFRIDASGLKPNTAFTVFLIEKSGAPFGAAEYIGDFDTNRYGNAHNTFKLIVEEAFAFNNETQDRTDLNSVGVWFADPKDDDGCLGAGSPVTGFDGDASAGVQMLNSRAQLLP